MTDFVFNPKLNYPFVLTDGNEGKILISGVSIPDDPKSFFMPLKAWIDDYLTYQSDSLVINFEMFFYNRTTSNYFFKLLHSLKDYNEKGKKIEVNWYYYPNDDDVREDGEDFEYQLKFPIHVIEYQPFSTFSNPRSEKTPLVYFDPLGDIVVDGCAKGQKPWEYFYPLIKWVDSIRFSEEQLNLKLEVSLTAIDELNLKYLKHIFNQLKVIDKKEGKTVRILWKYTDNGIKNIGSDLLKRCCLNHQLIEV